MTRFVGIPTVPMDTDASLIRILMTLKENVELLTDQRGESDGASVALTKGEISEQTLTDSYQALTARGQGASISNVTVPLLDDYAKALSDIQRLANDVATLRTVLNQLITELRS